MVGGGEMGGGGGGGGSEAGNKIGRCDRGYHPPFESCVGLSLCSSVRSPVPSTGPLSVSLPVSIHALSLPQSPQSLFSSTRTVSLCCCNRVCSLCLSFTPPLPL